MAAERMVTVVVDQADVHFEEAIAILASRAPREVQESLALVLLAGILNAGIDPRRCSGSG